MSKRSRRLRFNPDDVAKAEAVAQTLQVEAPATKAEVKSALKEADEVTSEDVAAVGYYAPMGSLKFSDEKFKNLYEALRDADVKFQKKIARVVDFIDPVFGAVQKVTFGKISADDLKKILALKLPTAGTALFLELAFGGRPLDESAIAVAKILRRELVAGASTFAIITGLAAAVDLALLIPGAQFLAPVAATLTPMAAVAIPAGLACGGVAALLGCVIDKRMPSEEELATVMKATAKLAKSPAPSKTQVSLAYKAYGENTGAAPGTERKNPRRGKKGRKNPVRRVPIEGARVSPEYHSQEIFTEYTHPIHETGQRRFFALSEMGRSHPSYEEGADVDTFVYEDVPELPEQEEGNWRSRWETKKLKKQLRDVVLIDDAETVFVQPSVFSTKQSIEDAETRLMDMAEAFREKAEELYNAEQEQDRSDMMHDSFMEWLSNISVRDIHSTQIQEAITQAEEAGVPEEAILDVLQDPSNWGDLEEGHYGDFVNTVEEWEIELSWGDDDDLDELKDKAQEIFESIIPYPNAEKALHLWLVEALRRTDWRVERNGLRSAISFSVCAEIKDDDVIEKLEELAAGYEAEQAQEGEGEGQTPYSQRVMPRRPYTPPETSDLLEHITLPHDYVVYNVSWQEFQAIGSDMKICVGGHGYAERVKRGDIQIWVVRDPNGVNLFCLEVHFADPEHLHPSHFVQVKGLRNRFPGWSDKDFYAYGGEPYAPLRTRAKNPINVDTALTARELGSAQPVPGGEVALCRSLCEQVGLDPYLQPDLLCGLYAKERFEVFDAREPQYKDALARAQHNAPRANPYAPRWSKRNRKNPLELRWPHGTSFAVEYWHDEYADEHEDTDDIDAEDDERTNPRTRPLHAPAKPPALAEGAVYKALWIGGPPGQTMVKLKKKLENQGITVVRQVIDEKIPPMQSYDLVLFNIEHASHADFYTAKDMAKAASVPFILAGHSWSKTHQNLKEAGFIRRNPR